MADSRGDANSNHIHICPRCGYDQQGEIARWEVAEPAACPLQGRCSECGLELNWRLIFRPELEVPGWFIENAERGGMMWAAVRTATRSLAPWSFWKRIRMEYAVVLRRAVLVAMLIAFTSYAAMVVCVVVSRRTFMSIGNRIAELFSGRLDIPLWFPFSKEAGGNSYRWWARGIDTNGAFGLDHVLQLGDAVVLLASLIVPFTFMVLPGTLRACRVRGRHLARTAFYISPWCIFVAGPLLRILAYGAEKSDHIFSAVGENGRWWIGMLGSRAPSFVVAFSATWMFLAWGFACSRYLRLPHAWLVAACMVGIAMLAAMVVVMVIWPVGISELFSGLV
jgi:hypothetical protein